MPTRTKDAAIVAILVLGPERMPLNRVLELMAQTQCRSFTPPTRRYAAETGRGDQKGHARPSRWAEKSGPGGQAGVH